MNALKPLLKGKKVLEVQKQGERVFLHFDDCVLECENPHFSPVLERIPWSKIGKS